MSFLLHILGWFTAATPQFLIEKFARALGGIVFCMLRSRRRMMLMNLHYCFPEKTETQRRAIALESCKRTIELGMFVLAAPHFSRERIKRQFKIDSETIDKLLEAKTPIVAAVPHFTLMESLTMIPALCPSVSERDCGVFYRPFDNRAIERWVKRTRERFGMHLLSRKRGLTQALDFLGSNGIICVLFDQSAGSRRGAISLFGGRVATSSVLAGMLAAGKPNTKTIATYCERTGFWRGNVRFEEIFPKEKNSAGYTIAFNRWLEKKLAKSDDACADWLWLHDRWKGFEGFSLAHKKTILPETLDEAGLDTFPRKKRIWIRLPNWLGDIVMAFPLIQTMRAARPDAEFTLVARKHFLPMLELLGIADRLVALPPKGKGYWKFCRNLRAEYPEQWYLFTNSLRGDLEAWLAGARMRAGMVRPGKPRPLLTRKWNVPENLDLTKNHQTRVWERWLRERHDLRASLDFSPIKLANAEPTAFRIGLICGTENSPEKRWSVERWRELIALLCEKFPQLEIYLFGTAKDGAITAQVAAGQDEKIVDRAGKTSLPDYMRELASCRAICGNDTGGMHLANMLGVPVVGIFGPTNPVRTGPIFDAPTEILQPENCPPTGGMDISLVPAKRAADAIAKILENVSENAPE